MLEGLVGIHPGQIEQISDLSEGLEERRRSRMRETNAFMSPSWTGGHVCLDIRVTRDNIQRSLRIMDSLLKALEACGMRLLDIREHSHRSVLLEVLRHRYKIHLSELTSRKPHAPTPEEIKLKRTNPRARVPKWDEFPNGMLGLTLISEMGHQSVRSWNEAEASPLEEKIAEVFRGILEVVDAAQARQRQLNEEAQRQAREAQLKREAGQRRRDEQARVDWLLSRAGSGEQARQVRLFLSELERTALEVQGPIEKGSLLDCWLNWAHAVADRLDPVTPYRRPPEPEEPAAQTRRNEAIGQSTAAPQPSEPSP